MKRKFDETKGTIRKVRIRKHEYDVLIHSSADPSTIIEFRYLDGCILYADIFIEDDLPEENLQAMLESLVKHEIYIHNKIKDSRKRRIS